MMDALRKLLSEATMTRNEAIASAEKFQVWTYSLRAGTLEYELRSEHPELADAQRVAIVASKRQRIMFCEITAWPSGETIFAIRSPDPRIYYFPDGEDAEDEADDPEQY